MSQFKWLPDSDGRIHETQKGNKYRYGTFQNGGRCLLFPDFCEFARTVSWYAPTEKHIFATNDNEIITVYKKKDKDNKIKKKDRKKLYQKEVIKNVCWKSNR